MKLRKVQVTAFGRFQNLNLEFTPGLNVIFGPNEAGKSTLLRFIQGMLFGLQKPGALRRQALPELERLTPWNGAPPRGGLIYNTDDGRVYRVERDFSEKGFVRIYDATTGQELTSRYKQDRRKELLFAEEQLGLNDGTFTATACIGQMQAGQLGITQELSARLANLAGSGQEDLSITSVLKLLDGEMAKIGHPSRDSGKPLAESIRRVSRLEAEHERAQAVRQENMENERRLADLRRESADTAGRVGAMAQALAVLRRREAEQRLGRLRDLRRGLILAEERSIGLKGAAEFPATDRDRVIALSESVQRLTRDERDAAAALGRLKEEETAAAARNEGFKPLLELDPDAEAQISRNFERYTLVKQDLQQRLEAKQGLEAEAARLTEGIAVFGVLAGEADALEGRLDELDEQSGQGEVERTRLAQSRPELAAQREAAVKALGARSGLALWISLAAAAAAAGLAAVVRQPLLAALAVAALPLWLLLRRPTAAARQAAEEAEKALTGLDERLQSLDAGLTGIARQKSEVLARAGSATVAEFKARARECHSLLRERDSARSQAERLEADLRNIARTLQVTGEALVEMVAASRQVAAGLSPDSAASDLPNALALTDAHIREFRQAWVAYRRARETVDSLALQVRQAEQRLARIREELEGARADLQQRLNVAGVASLDEYGEAFRRYQAYREAETARGTAAEVLRQALTEGDEAGLESLLAELAAVPENVPEAWGEDIAELARRWEAAKEELSRQQAEVRGLEERLEQAYRDLPDVAALEAELEEARRSRQGLEDRRWLLERAREEVEAASEEVHREFAPRLNQVASAAIGSITGGRYSEVRADSRLGLRVVVPETGELRSVDDLSGGTLDQFYLALRTGMAGLLTAGGETVPFLLDDTFVQFDDQRLTRAVGYLLEVTKTSQVLLFTCHQREVEAARRYQSGVRVLELPGPVVR